MAARRSCQDRCRDAAPRCALRSRISLASRLPIAMAPRSVLSDGEWGRDGATAGPTFSSWP